MPFIPIPKDKARRAVNPDTGEIISRRQYDERYGRLAGTGLTYDSMAKARKSGGFLGGSKVSRKADTGFFMFPSGLTDQKREDVLRHLDRKDAHMVRFVYEENGKRQSSNWYVFHEGNLEDIIVASKTDLHYPKKGGGEDTYSANSLIGFAFV